MEQVDRALLISLGIKGTEIDSDVEVEEHEVAPEPQETLSIFQSMGQQLRFWQDIEVKVSLIKNEISRLDDEIKLTIEGIVMTIVDFRTNYARDIFEKVHKTYSESVGTFETYIPLSVKAAETSAEGVSIFEH